MQSQKFLYNFLVSKNSKCVITEYYHWRVHAGINLQGLHYPLPPLSKELESEFNQLIMILEIMKSSWIPHSIGLDDNSCSIKRLNKTFSPNPTEVSIEIRASDADSRDMKFKFRKISLNATRMKKIAFGIMLHSLNLPK